MKPVLYSLFIFVFSFCQFLTAQTNISAGLDHQNYKREYLVHLPPSYTGNMPVPLVIFLHGGNGNVQTAQAFTLFNQVANRNGFLMVYPQGCFETKPNRYVWADGRGTGADLAGIDDVGFIDKMVDSLLSNYTIDAKRVYLCGFSNGSFMTQRMAFQANEKFAAMATLGGSIDSGLYNSGDPGRAVPMFYLLGTADPYVPYDGGVVAGSETIPVVGIEQAVQFWVNNNNCSTAMDSVNLADIDTTDHSFVTVFGYTDCDCNADVRFYKVIGGGHTWPGVELIAREPLLGETNEDILASRELWDFFKTHSLCSTTAVHEEARSMDFELYGNYPNPFNASTTIHYRLFAGSKVTVKIFDVLGRETGVLIDGYQPAGEYRARFEAGELSSGIYFYALCSEKFTATAKMLLVK